MRIIEISVDSSLMLGISPTLLPTLQGAVTPLQVAHRLFTMPSVQLPVSLHQHRRNHAQRIRISQPYFELMLRELALSVFLSCAPIVLVTFNACLSTFWTNYIFAAARNFNPLYKLRVVPSFSQMLTQLKRARHEKSLVYLLKPLKFMPQSGKSLVPI